MTAEQNAEIALLKERVLDLEIDLGRITSLFGLTVDEVTEAVAEIRALKAKSGDGSVNAMIAMAMKRVPCLAEARNAIDKQLLLEAQRTTDTLQVITSPKGRVTGWRKFIGF